MLGFIGKKKYGEAQELIEFYKKSANDTKIYNKMLLEKIAKLEEKYEDMKQELELKNKLLANSYEVVGTKNDKCNELELEFERCNAEKKNETIRANKFEDWYKNLICVHKGLTNDYEGLKKQNRKLNKIVFDYKIDTLIALTREQRKQKKSRKKKQKQREIDNFIVNTVLNEIERRAEG